MIVLHHSLSRKIRFLFPNVDRPSIKRYVFTLADSLKLLQTVKSLSVCDLSDPSPHGLALALTSDLCQTAPVSLTVSFEISSLIENVQMSVIITDHKCPTCRDWVHYSGARSQPENPSSSLEHFCILNKIPQCTAKTWKRQCWSMFPYWKWYHISWSFSAG